MPKQSQLRLLAIYRCMLMEKTGRVFTNRMQSPPHPPSLTDCVSARRNAITTQLTG